jgi:heme oxygenase
MTEKQIIAAQCLDEIEACIERLLTACTADAHKEINKWIRVQKGILKDNKYKGKIKRKYRNTSKPK